MAENPEQVKREQNNWHWRNSMRPVRFFNLDARAAIPFIILLFYFRIISLVITLAITGIFVFLERRGLTLPAALRAFRSWFSGQSRSAWYSMRKRKLKDYG